MDINILLWIQEMRNDFLNVFFQGITFLAEDKFFYYVLGAMYWCFDKELGLLAGFYLNIAGIVNTFVKSVLRVPRPFYRNPNLKPVASAEAGATGFSCPSGHTSQASSIYGGIAFSGKVKKWIRIVMVILTILMAFSRMYLGVHTLQDVLLALVIAAATMFLMNEICEWIQQGKKRDILFAVILVCCAIILALISFGIPYDASLEETMYRTYMDIIKKLMMLLAFVGCWLWDRRSIHYEVPTQWRQKLIFFLIGALCIALLYNIGREYVNWICIALFQKKIGKIVGRGVGSGILIAWVYGLYPWIILKIRREIEGRKKHE